MDKLILKYQGQSFSRSRTEKSFIETWQGPENLIDEKIKTLSIGTFNADKGYLNSMEKTQDDGIYYSLQLEYVTNYDVDDSTLDDTAFGKKSAQLSVRNIQMPLEAHENYLTNWNYYLIGLQGSSVPAWWATAKDTLITNDDDLKKYKWVKSISEIPTQKDQQSGKKWKILKKPKKLGYQYYDLACFVVTETSKHKSANFAANAIEKNINQITKPNNDFGISGGNWKLDQCSISYTGGYWLATKTYTRSGDEKGWDTQIYN